MHRDMAVRPSRDASQDASRHASQVTGTTGNGLQEAYQGAEASARYARQRVCQQARGSGLDAMSIPLSPLHSESNDSKHRGFCQSRGEVADFV